MDSPRRCSSASRSGSVPVSARTRVDLPWSTWPAVAITCMSVPGALRGEPDRVDECVVVARVESDEIEQQPAALHPPDDGERTGAQRPGEVGGESDCRAGQPYVR